MRQLDWPGSNTTPVDDVHNGASSQQEIAAPVQNGKPVSAQNGKQQPIPDTHRTQASVHPPIPINGEALLILSARICHCSNDHKG